MAHPSSQEFPLGNIPNNHEPRMLHVRRQYLPQTLRRTLLRPLPRITLLSSAFRLAIRSTGLDELDLTMELLVRHLEQRMPVSTYVLASGVTVALMTDGDTVNGGVA